MQSLIAHLLRRPVGLTAFYLLLLSLATLALARLPVALLPSVTYPSLVIWTPWAEVSPEQVERGVTEPVEQAVAALPGLVDLTSHSQLGGSLVRLDFGWNADVDLVALEARSHLDRVAGRLPEGAGRPLVLRVDPGDRPILVLAVGVGTASPMPEGGPGRAPELATLIEGRRIARQAVARRLEQLDGVARVRVTGGHEEEIQVRLDADRMAAYGLDLLHVEQALRATDVSLAGGTLRKGPYRYPVEVSGELRDRAEVAATVISPPGRSPVRLREVAEVREGIARRRGLVRHDGREVLLLLVERRPDANTVETAAQVRRELAALRKELPGVSLEVVVDESTFIRAALGGVVQALLVGGLLALLMLFAFLRRLRMLGAVAVAVPFSLAVALVLFDHLGMSLNLISLGGLALGVGLLVDNSIVVAENIARLREGGLDPFQASVQGAAQVAAPITASTLTTLAVFVPLTFAEGLAGRLFRDQSLAVACSVGASLLVALTAVPALTSREGAAGRRAGAQPRPAPPSPGLRFYEWALDRCLARPGRVGAGVAAFLLLSMALAWHLPRQVTPEADEGRLRVRLTLPPDADLPLLSARSTHLETYLKGLPGVSHILADLGERDDARLELDPRPPYAGELTVVLHSGTETAALLEAIRTWPAPADLQVEAHPVRPRLATLLTAGEGDLFVDLVGDRRQITDRVQATLLAALRRRPELAHVTLETPAAASGYDLTFRRDAIVRLVARPEDLDRHLEAAARGREVARLQRLREEIPVVLRTAGATSVQDLLGRWVPAGERRLPLSTFVQARPTSRPVRLSRRGQAPVVRILVERTPGVDLGAAIASIEAATGTVLPAGVRLRTGGAGEAFRQSLGAVARSLVWSVLLIYLLLAAQLESLWQPLVVLAVVPLAVGGVALGLALMGQSWNLMSLTGCVVLVGLAVNDAILKVDFIQSCRARGASLGMAVRQAGRYRYRPILMTTLTTTFGLLPLGLGAGGSLGAPLGLAILWGLGVATLLTLLVVPVLFQTAARLLGSPGLERHDPEINRRELA